MSKLPYPKGRMLQVRDCTVGICNRNNPGAALLSTFLFWYEYPHQGDVYSEEEGTFTICRTQTDIEIASCHQIDVKTIHDTAVPLLQLFGYLTVKEKMNGNLYTINIKHVLAGYTAYGKGAEAMKQFLKASLQLESAPISIPEDQLELTLINKRWLYLQLASVLIQMREDSNCKRGRKPKLQEASVPQNADIQNLQESLKTNTKREGVIVSTSHPSPSFSDTESQFQQATASTPVTADTATTGQAAVIPIAAATTQITDVTQALTTDGIEPTGYMKGESDESSTDSIWDRDARSAARDSDLLPAAERPLTRGTQDQAIQETQTAQVTQQTPLLQTTASVLSSDARESNVTPPVAPLVLLTTLQQTSLLSDMSLDALLTQPPRRIDVKALLAQVRGQATETIRASADTSLETTNTGTNDALWESTTAPVSPTKTIQASKNKKPRGKIEKPLPTPEELAFNARCIALQERINEWRGYDLVDKGPLINERKRIRDLAGEYSDDTIERIRTYLFNRHWKWSKPDNRFKIGAQILWEEAKSVLQILKDEEQNKGKTSSPLGGMYRDKTDELRREREKYMCPPAPVVTQVAAPAASFSYIR